LTIGLLEIGLQRTLQIREERLSNRPDVCRLMYVSDIHLRQGRSKNLIRQIIASAQQAEPHAILLGGDLVDRAAELGELRALIDSLRGMAPVLAVGGNHDANVGMDRVREAVVAGGGTWIHDDVGKVFHKQRVILIFGPEASTVALPDGDVRILCAHNPRIWKSARHQCYDLVLAGHLHGCQFVAFEFRNRLFPGAIFYPYCYLTHHYRSTTLVVSRGVSDLIPIRWRCPREVVLCYV
jgi:predicted MPP superfamily phosphohydrolase